MTSNELPKRLAVSDRIPVPCEGQVTAVIPPPGLNKAMIMNAATQFLDRDTNTDADAALLANAS